MISLPPSGGFFIEICIFVKKKRIFVSAVEETVF